MENDQALRIFYQIVIGHRKAGANHGMKCEEGKPNVPAFTQNCKGSHRKFLLLYKESQIFFSMVPSNSTK